MRNIVGLLAVLLLGCTERARATPAAISDAGPRSRFAVKVESGTFSTTLDTRLEAELILALARQPDLEIVSNAVAEKALTKQHVCEPEQDFAACRVRQLGLAGDFLVEIEIGAVPGTWVLTTAVTPAGDVLSWLPTLPFSQQQGESLEDAVVRAARLLGASLGPDGLRRGVVFPPAARGTSTVARACSAFNAPWSLSSQLAWQSRVALRARLHQLDREAELATALAELKEASKPGDAHCEQLATLISWQERAVNRGWLPSELRSETWRANVDIELRGSAPDGLADALAGSLAARGVTLRSVRPAQEACEDGFDCIDGFSVSDVQPTGWLVAARVDSSGGKLSVNASLVFRDGAGKARALPLPRLEAADVAALRPALDAAITEVLARIK
ncbi:MAG: hypothetical protein Q8L48_15705 [Archangium sp.]|nr:hypothetical protein [Archangium sp.]